MLYPPIGETLRRTSSSTTDFQTMKVQYSEIPDSLKIIPRWHLWKDVKGRKIPIQATSGMKSARSNDPSTWTTFDIAVEAHKQLSRDHDNLGLAFEIGTESCDHPVTGFDFDDCFTLLGEMQPWAREVWDLIKRDCYAEVSPSGKGFKALVAGEKPKGFRCRNIIKGTQAIEVYGKSRFWTITGDVIPNEGILGKDDPDMLRNAVKVALNQTNEQPEPQQQTAMPSGQSGVERATLYLSKIGPISEGSRNSSLFGLAGHLFSFGLDESMVIALLQQWQLANVSPPLTLTEVTSLVRSSNKNGTPRKPKGESEFRYEPIEHTDEMVLDVRKLWESAQSRKKYELKDVDFNAPGLISEILARNKELAESWLPELAFASALATMSAITCGKVTAEGTHPNLFMVGLAPSGAGKDFGRKLTRDTLYRAGFSEVLGAEVLSSGEGFVKSLETQNVQLFQLDEIAEMFGEMGDANHYMAKTGKLLKQAYSSSGDPEWKPNCRADAKNNIIVREPFPIIYGTTTPDLFYSRFSPDSVNDGLLGRLLIFSQEHYDISLGRIYQQMTATESIVDKAKSWKDASAHGNLPPESFPGNRLNWTFSKESKNELLALSDEIKLNSTRGKENTGLWRRTADKIQKLALLFACSRLGPVQDGIVEHADTLRAILIVKRLTYRSIHKVQTELVKSQADADRQKVLTALKNRGGRIPKGRISVYDKLSKKTRKDVIEDLLESDRVRLEQGKDGVLYYVLNT